MGLVEIGKVKCKECGYEHTIQAGFTTTEGGICNLLALTDIEVEFYCKCGEKIIYDERF